MLRLLVQTFFQRLGRATQIALCLLFWAFPLVAQAEDASLPLEACNHSRATHGHILSLLQTELFHAFALNDIRLAAPTMDILMRQA